MAHKTQKTQPKQGEPASIPVPKRGDFDKVLARAAQGRKGKASKKKS